jgi:5-methylcytosine-specific restriction endonuclease McrA
MPRKTKGQREYMERLRDPRWQRTRLAVLERADWSCEGCGTREVNLQIHHGYYERGLLPWEYPPEALFCLCDICHEWAEAKKAEAYGELGLIPPWQQPHAVTLLRELRRLLADGVSDEQLASLTVERAGD